MQLRLHFIQQHQQRPTLQFMRVRDLSFLPHIPYVDRPADSLCMHHVVDLLPGPYREDKLFAALYTLHEPEIYEAVKKSIRDSTEPVPAFVSGLLTLFVRSIAASLYAFRCEQRQGLPPQLALKVAKEGGCDEIA